MLTTLRNSIYPLPPITYQVKPYAELALMVLLPFSLLSRPIRFNNPLSIICCLLTVCILAHYTLSAGYKAGDWLSMRRAQNCSIFAKPLGYADIEGLNAKELYNLLLQTCYPELFKMQPDARVFDTFMLFPSQEVKIPENYRLPDINAINAKLDEKDAKTKHIVVAFKL